MTPAEQSVLDTIKAFESQGNYAAADALRARFNLGTAAPVVAPGVAPVPAEVAPPTDLGPEQEGLAPFFLAEATGQPRFAASVPAPVRPAPAPPPAPAPAPTARPAPVIPSAGTEFIAPPFQASGPVVSGEAEAMRLRNEALARRQERVNYLINRENYSPAEAEDIADVEFERTFFPVSNVEGEPTSRGFGIGLLAPVPPFFRETMITYEDGQPIFNDPITGAKSPASVSQQVVEAMARQPVLTPEEAAERRKVRSIERELAVEDIPGSLLYLPDYRDEVRAQIADRESQTFERLFAQLDPRTGRVIETPLAAVLRNTGIVSTLVNEAALSLPLFYDVDDQGNPVNKQQFAYKAHEFLVDAAEAAGMDRKDAEEALTGRIGGSVLPTPALVPVPFSGINRKGATPIDPTGFRGVTETESFLGDVALSLAKGRFLGDELYSVEGLVQDLQKMSFQNNELSEGRALYDDIGAPTTFATLYPMIYGAGAEMLYGIGPVAAVGKVGRLAGQGTKLASTAARAKAAAALATAAEGSKAAKVAEIVETAARGGEQVGAFVANPVEYSKRVKQISVIQDMMDGAPEQPDLNALMDASEARKVAANVIAKDVLTPYVMVQRAGADDNFFGTKAGVLKEVAGDSVAGRQFLKDMGVTELTPDDEIIRVNKIQNAYVNFRTAVNKTQIEATLADRTLSETEKASRIFSLIADPISTGGAKSAEEYFARVSATLGDQMLLLTPAQESLVNLAAIATGGNIARLNDAIAEQRRAVAAAEGAVSAIFRKQTEVQRARGAAARQARVDAANPPLFPEAAKANREAPLREAQAALDEQRRYLRQLEATAERANARLAKVQQTNLDTVARDLLAGASDKAYPPVRAGAPIYQILHDFGISVADSAPGAQQRGLSQALTAGEQGRVLNNLYPPGDFRRPARPLRGPVADSYLRRLGATEVTGQVVRDNPLFSREAALGAGARAVEATLENVIPSDLVFVSSTLMAPRQQLTPAVRREVAAEMAKFPFSLGDSRVVNDKSIQTYIWQPIEQRALVEALGGPEAIRRSPLKSSIFANVMETKPLLPVQHQTLQDALLSQAYTKALRGQVSEAIFAGPQTQQARVPTATLSALSELGEMAGEAQPRQSRTLAEAREPTLISLPFQGVEVTRNMLGSMFVRDGKRFQQEKLFNAGNALLNYSFTATPAIYETTFNRIENAVSSIPDNFQREVRDAAQTGLSPELAFNTVLNRRVSREAQRIAADMKARANELVETGLTEEEAYSLLTYQTRQGTAQRGVGKEIAKGGIIANAEKEALRAATEESIERNWKTIISSFFGGDVFATVIAPNNDLSALYPYIKVGENYRAISLGNMQEVIGLIRKENPNLKLRGLARERLPGGALVTQATGGLVKGTEDAIFDTLASWAMNKDRELLISENVSRMFDENPWMVTHLVPNYNSADFLRPQVEADAVANARGYVIGALDALAQQRKQGKAQADARVMRYHLIRAGGRDRALVTGRTLTGAKRADQPQRRIPGTPFVVAGKETPEGVPPFDPFLRELDDITVRAYRNLTPGARQDLVRSIYSKMLEEGTQAPNLAAMVAETFDDPRLNQLFFEKKATTETLSGLLARLDNAALRGARLSPRDRALYDSIIEVRNSFTEGKTGADFPEALGRANGAIITGMRRALLQNALESFVLPAAAEMQANLRAAGWTPDAARARQDLPILVDSLNPQDPRFAVAGQDFIDALSKVKAASRDGKLADNLEALQKSDKLARALEPGMKADGQRGAGTEVASYVLGTLGQAVANTRTAAAGGLLAGGLYVYTTEDGVPLPIPMPNTRYLGMNLLTVPFIAATTIGTVGALRMLPGTIGPATQAQETARQFAGQYPFLGRPLVNTLSPGDMREVLFTSQTGKPWTRGEFFEAVDRNAINISRGGMEYADQFARELARDARLTAAGVEAKPLRQYLLRNMDPTRTGVFQYAANATDRAMRQNVFASALREGMTEEQAAQMARNVVLDYGKAKFTQGLNKYIMFLAFREAMMRETLEALARDPSAINRTMLLHRDLSKQMDNELQADHSRYRLPFPKTFIFDNTAASKVYGPVNPSLDMYGDAVQFAGFILQQGAADIPQGTVAQAIADENLSPVIDAILAPFVNRPSPGGKGAKVPDEWVAYAIENSPEGLWPWMKQTYNIEPVLAAEDRTPGRLTAVDPRMPEEGKLEYRFSTPADATRFAQHMSVLQTLGMQRTTTDYTNMGLTYGVGDYIDPKRRGLPTTFGFAIGLETPMTMRSPEELTRRALRQQEQTARAKEVRE